MRRHAEHKWFPEQKELWCAGEQGREGGPLPQAPRRHCSHGTQGLGRHAHTMHACAQAQQGATLKDGWEAMRLPRPSPTGCTLAMSWVRTLCDCLGEA